MVRAMSLLGCIRLQKSLHHSCKLQPFAVTDFTKFPTTTAAYTRAGDVVLAIKQYHS